MLSNISHRTDNPKSTYNIRKDPIQDRLGAGILAEQLQYLQAVELRSAVMQTPYAGGDQGCDEYQTLAVRSQLFGLRGLTTHLLFEIGHVDAHDLKPLLHQSVYVHRAGLRGLFN